MFLEKTILKKCPREKHLENVFKNAFFLEKKENNKWLFLQLLKKCLNKRSFFIFAFKQRCKFLKKFFEGNSEVPCECTTFISSNQMKNHPELFINWQSPATRRRRRRRRSL